jgi:hypothetical protein
MTEYGQFPYGLRDIEITPINADGSYGSPVELNAEQTLSGQLVVSNAELRGADKVVTSVTMIDRADWSLDEGGLPLEAMEAMLGGTLTTSGTTPNEKKTLSFAGGGSFPYFKLEGRALTPDPGGDFHMVLYRCQVTSPPQWQMQDQNFLVSSISGVALPDPNNDDKIFDVVSNETAVAL